MNLVFSDQAFPRSILKSMFLAGPSPRSKDQTDWRQEAIRLLDEKGFTGTVFIPIPRDIFYGQGTNDIGYDNQIEWEHKARLIADNIVFWVPRVLDFNRTDLGMPAFTTNFELGEDLNSGKLTYGRPDSAVKCKYLDLRVTGKGYPVHENLSATLDAAIQTLGAGELRNEGEVNVPLFIWQTPQFQAWYGNLKCAGNVLHDAEVLHNVKFGPDFVFSYVLAVRIWVTSEQRLKSNEFVFARRDIGVVMAYHQNAKTGVTKIALVKEFRSTVNNPDGYVYELPGGSSRTPGEAPALAAQHELQEELGLAIRDASRLHYVGERQLVATLSSHKASVYAIKLSDDELVHLEQESAANLAHGVAEDSERTYVRVVDVKDIFQSLVDYSTLGIIFEVMSALAPTATDS